MPLNLVEHFLNTFSFTIENINYVINIKKVDFTKMKIQGKFLFISKLVLND